MGIILSYILASLHSSLDRVPGHQAETVVGFGPWWSHPFQSNSGRHWQRMGWCTGSNIQEHVRITGHSFTSYDRRSWGQLDTDVWCTRQTASFEFQLTIIAILSMVCTLYNRQPSRLETKVCCLATLYRRLGFHLSSECRSYGVSLLAIKHLTQQGKKKHIFRHFLVLNPACIAYNYCFLYQKR